MLVQAGQFCSVRSGVGKGADSQGLIPHGKLIVESWPTSPKRPAQRKAAASDTVVQVETGADAASARWAPTDNWP